MKKTVAVLCGLFLLLFAGCSEKSIYKPTEIENVNISISDISSTGATVTIKDTNKTPYVYGEWYEIEKQINDEWHKIEAVINNYGFEDIGYLTNDKGEVDFSIEWELLYGELPSGKYRLLKQVDNQYVSVEFSIPVTSS